MRIKFFILFLVLLSGFIHPQAEYVQYNHPVYSFLQRMDALKIISNYNSLEFPKTRKTIASYLREVIAAKEDLTGVDRKMLDDYCSEFELEIFGTQERTTSLIGSTDYSFFSPKEKYFYSLVDTSRFTIFVNVIGNLESIINQDLDKKTTKSGAFARWGGTLRGTILNKFGYYMRGTNGKFWGERSIAGQINELKFNYKFNADPRAVTATDYFDNTEGYLTLDYDLVRFKLGREQKQIGYGHYKTILDVNTPQFDYFSFDIDYKAFNFSYFHGKLLGRSSVQGDSIQGIINSVDSKYIGYHRLGVKFSDHFALGAGEIIIYANRPVDFSYLNPFNFYKGTEHANQDRDNSMLFFDFSNNSFRGLRLSGSVLIDDIDFGKIGTGWYGNQLAYNLNFYSANFYPIIPLELQFQYIRVEPYVYTHRIYNNNYSNLGYSLVSPVLPNSEIFYLGLSYHPTYRLGLNLDFTYSVHGANELNSNGTIKRNVGGDPNIGMRAFDEPIVHFLDGVHEYFRSITFSAVFEPVKNYFISGELTYGNNDLQNSHGKYLAAYALINLRI
ncbi:MAG: hypothetical protein ACM34K_20545 [Bacillota bacterium]